MAVLSVPLLFMMLYFTSMVVTTPVAMLNGVLEIPVKHHVEYSDPNSSAAADLPGRELVRAARMRSGGHDTLAKRVPTIASLPVSGSSPYTLSVDAGQGTYTVALDSGSAYFWVGGNGKPFLPSLSAEATGETKTVTYFDGSEVTGTEWCDSVKVGGNTDLEVTKQYIIAASDIQSTTIKGVDGVIGLSPPGAQGDTSSIVFQNLCDLDRLIACQFSLYFTPSMSTAAAAAQDSDTIIFGGIPAAQLLMGASTTLERTAVAPSSQYWGVDLTVTYGQDRKPILPPPPADETGQSSNVNAPQHSFASGVLDSGTLRVLLSDDAMEEYGALTGAKAIPFGSGSFWALSQDNYETLQSLYFNIGGTEFEFTADAQACPAQCTLGTIASNLGAVFLNLGSIGSNSGSGLDFLLGSSWLQRFSTTYNAATNMITISETIHTKDKSNQGQSGLSS